MPLGPKSELVEELLEMISSTRFVEAITEATRDDKTRNMGEITINQKQYKVWQMQLLTPSQVIRKYQRTWLKK